MFYVCLSLHRNLLLLGGDLLDTWRDLFVLHISWPNGVFQSRKAVSRLTKLCDSFLDDATHVANLIMGSHFISHLIEIDPCHLGRPKFCNTFSSPWKM